MLLKILILKKMTTRQIMKMQKNKKNLQTIKILKRRNILEHMKIMKKIFVFRKLEIREALGHMKLIKKVFLLLSIILLIHRQFRLLIVVESKFQAFQAPRSHYIIKYKDDRERHRVMRKHKNLMRNKY